MSETSTEPAETSEEQRIDTLESKVDRILDMLSGSGKPETAEPEPAADPKAEVRAELAKLQRAEKAKQAREAKEQAGENRMKALEDKVFEKPPEEHRKGFTGWWQKANQWHRDVK